MPNLNLTLEADNEVPTRGGKRERGDRRLEGEVVENNPARYICQNSLAIFVD